MTHGTRRQGQPRGQGAPKKALRFTVADIAEVTGVSVRTLRRHIAAGRLPVIRRKSSVFITPAGARVWLGHDLHFWNTKKSESTFHRFVSIRVYAAITKRSEREVRHLIDKGAVKTVRGGGRVYVDGEEVAALFKMGDS